MDITIGILGAFGAMLCWGVGDFLIQRSVRKIGNLEALAAIGITGTLGLLPFIFKDIPLLLQPSNLFLLLVLSVITFITSVLNFEAFREGKLSVVDVILEVELPVTIVFAWMFLRETVSPAQLFILFVIFIGVILVAIESLSLSHLKKSLEKGAVLAFFAAVMMGLSNFFTAASARTISPLLAIWLPWMIVSVLCIGVLVKRGTFLVGVHNAIASKRLIIAMGILDTLAWLLYAFTLQSNQVAIATGISESYPAIAVMLGVWFNKESVKKHQYLGVIVALGASIVLAIIA